MATTCKLYALVNKPYIVLTLFWVFYAEIYIQSGGVTRRHCPCRNELYTGSIKQTPDMEAFGTFSIF